MTEADLSAVIESGVWEKITGGPKSWVVLNIDPDNKKRVIVHASGRCGLDRMKAALLPDQIQFGGFRVFAVEPAVKQPKFLSFVWTGPQANLKTKVAATTIKASVLKHFEGSSAELQVDSLDALTEEEVVKRLSLARGSHQPSGGFQFGTGNPDDLEDAELEAAAAAQRAVEEEEARVVAAAAAVEAERLRAVAEDEARVEAARLVEEERARRRQLLPTRMENSAEAKRTPRDPLIAGYDFSELTERFALESLGDVEDPQAWVAVHVPEASPKKVVLLGSGSGGPEELLPLLSDEDVVFGALRVTAVDRRGKTVSLRARVVYFTWTGGAISTKTRFRNTPVIRAMGVYFETPALDLKLQGEAGDLDCASLAAKLHVVHAASEYKFGLYNKDAQVDEYFAQVEAAKLASDAEAARDSVKDQEYAAKAASKAAHQAAAERARAEAEAARAEALAAQREAEAAAEELARLTTATPAKMAAEIIKASKASRGSSDGGSAEPASPSPAAAVTHTPGKLGAGAWRPSSASSSSSGPSSSAAKTPAANGMSVKARVAASAAAPAVASPAAPAPAAAAPAAVAAPSEAETVLPDEPVQAAEEEAAAPAELAVEKEEETVEAEAPPAAVAEEEAPAPAAAEEEVPAAAAPSAAEEEETPAPAAAVEEVVAETPAVAPAEDAPAPAAVEEEATVAEEAAVAQEAAVAEKAAVAEEEAPTPAAAAVEEVAEETAAPAEAEAVAAAPEAEDAADDAANSDEE